MDRGTPGMTWPSASAASLMPPPRTMDTAGSVLFAGVTADVDAECGPAREVIRTSGFAAAPETVSGPTLRVLVGSHPDSSAWRGVADQLPGGPAELGPEGYAVVTTGGAQPRATVVGADPAGAYYGVRTLLGLIERRGDRLVLPEGRITDRPDLPWRGTIEGFYGPPWSHDDRLAHLEFAGRHRLNTYVYAPKDDPFHRARWREPYPLEELARLAELVSVAQAHHVRFVFTISPGLSMVYNDPTEMELLDAKLAQVWDVGVRDIGLLFDDIEPELAHDTDIALFGSSPGSSARAHAAVCRHVIDTILRPRGATGPLLMVPTDYAGTAASPYRDHLARELPEEVLVWWTGHDIVVGDVGREHIDQAAASYRHRMLLWDNFPVNDFDFSRVFLGPLQGRTTELHGAPLAGITANPMPQAAGSQIALATVAEWAWNPQAYDAQAAHGRAVAASTGGDPALTALATSCRSWPPSAPQHPELTSLLDALLNGSAETAAARAAFETMTRPAEPVTPEAVRLAGELRPWLDTQAVMGRTGLAALDHLAAPSGDTRDAAERALAAARAAEPNVLASVVPPFVEAVLRRG